MPRSTAVPLAMTPDTGEADEAILKKGETTMNSFRKKVYHTVSLLPRGRVATYGQIASLCGNPLAARAVGWAMRNAPAFLDLPCHRVVNKNGSLAPAYAFGGEHIQRGMLIDEGILFKDNGRIDMKSCLWIPEDLAVSEEQG